MSRLAPLGRRRSLQVPVAAVTLARIPPALNVPRPLVPPRLARLLVGGASVGVAWIIRALGRVSGRGRVVIVGSVGGIIVVGSVGRIGPRRRIRRGLVGRRHGVAVRRGRGLG